MLFVLMANEISGALEGGKRHARVAGVLVEGVGDISGIKVDIQAGLDVAEVLGGFR